MPVLFAALAAAMAACARLDGPDRRRRAPRRGPTPSRFSPRGQPWRDPRRRPGSGRAAPSARAALASAPPPPRSPPRGALALGYSWVNSAVMSASISQSSSSQSLFSGRGRRPRPRAAAARRIPRRSASAGGPQTTTGGRLGGAGVSLWYGGRPAGRVARPRRRRDLDARRAPPGVPRPHIKRCDEATDADADIARAGSRGRRRRLECEDPRDRAFARSLAGETKGRARARVGVRKGARGINVSLCC